MSLTILEIDGHQPLLTATPKIALFELGCAPAATWREAGRIAPTCLFLELPSLFKSGLDKSRALTIVNDGLIPSDPAMTGPAEDGWTIWALTARDFWTRHGYVEAFEGMSHGTIFFGRMREALQPAYLPLLASETLEIRLIAPGMPTPAW